MDDERSSSLVFECSLVSFEAVHCVAQACSEESYKKTDRRSVRADEEFGLDRDWFIMSEMEAIRT